MSARFKNPCSTALPQAALYIAILSAADRLQLESEQLLKAAGLTGAQYNVLRILRGAEPNGLPCRGISDNMISHDPDITRLLDRMEKRDLISRERQTDDRRVIKTRITAAGLQILKPLDQPMAQLHLLQFEHFSPTEVKTFASLLQKVKVRSPICPTEVHSNDDSRKGLRS